MKDIILYCATRINNLEVLRTKEQKYFIKKYLLKNYGMRLLADSVKTWQSSLVYDVHCNTTTFHCQASMCKCHNTSSIIANPPNTHRKGFGQPNLCSDGKH